MARHRRTRRQLKKQRKIIIISLICFMFIMVGGYAAFQTNLNITAKGNIKEEEIDFNHIILFNDILKHSTVSVTGNTPIVNNDKSLSFNGTQDNINNLIVPLLKADYSTSFTYGIDFYKYNTAFDSSLDAQCISMSRTNDSDGLFIYLADDRIFFDIGGSNIRNYIDNLDSGHYVLIFTFNLDEKLLNGYILINKDTNNIIVSKSKKNLNLLNRGFVTADYKLKIGGDNEGLYLGYTYPTHPNTKFYSYYINNKIMSEEDLKEIIKEFGVTQEIDLTELKSE